MTTETLTPPASAPAKCVAIAEAGITNSQQTISYLSALIADASAGRVTTGLVHGTCNAVGKMLRVVELEAKFGTTVGAGNEKLLQFVQTGRQPAKDNSHEIREQALAKLAPDERLALGLA